MAKQTFSVTTGNNQVIAMTPVIDPANPNGVIGVQNDGAVAITVKVKLLDQAAFATLGTVAAATVGSFSFVPGIVSMEISATSVPAVTGVIVW